MTASTVTRTRHPRKILLALVPLLVLVAVVSFGLWANSAPPASNPAPAVFAQGLRAIQAKPEWGKCVNRPQEPDTLVKSIEAQTPAMNAGLACVQLYDDLNAYAGQVGADEHEYTEPSVAARLATFSQYDHQWTLNLYESSMPNGYIDPGDECESITNEFIQTVQSVTGH